MINKCTFKVMKKSFKDGLSKHASVVGSAIKCIAFILLFLVLGVLAITFLSVAEMLTICIIFIVGTHTIDWILECNAKCGRFIGVDIADEIQAWNTITYVIGFLISVVYLIIIGNLGTFPENFIITCVLITLGIILTLRCIFINRIGEWKYNVRECVVCHKKYYDRRYSCFCSDTCNDRDKNERVTYAFNGLVMWYDRTEFWNLTQTQRDFLTNKNSTLINDEIQEICDSTAGDFLWRK